MRQEPTGVRREEEGTGDRAHRGLDALDHQLRRQQQPLALRPRARELLTPDTSEVLGEAPLVETVRPGPADRAQLGADVAPLLLQAGQFLGAGLAALTAHPHVVGQVAVVPAGVDRVPRVDGHDEDVPVAGDLPAPSRRTG